MISSMIFNIFNIFRVDHLAIYTMNSVNKKAVFFLFELYYSSS